MKSCLFIVPGLLFTLAFFSCMDYGPMEEEEFYISSPDAVFIINEGNFLYGNASLSYYDKEVRKLENASFSRANAIDLGDVAQSMAIYKGTGFVVVNNSGVIFAVDISTLKVKGQVTGLVSPRYVHIVNDTKAYVTDLYAARITVFNPKTYKITGYVETEGHSSTEQMVQYGKYVFTNCWSYDNKILVIDTETDRVVDEIEVGIQPTSLVIDKYHKIWTVTDGGYEGSVYGQETPALYKIDAASRQVERQYSFQFGDYPSEITINGAGDTIYYINKSIWRMDVTATRLPVRPFLEADGTLYYGLGIDPYNSEVYVADAVDYQQPGVVYRLDPAAQPLDTLIVGIIPGAFAFGN